MIDDASVDRWCAIAKLKAVDRAGWLRVGIEQPESVAAHSWGVAWLVLELLPEHLDLEKALSYAILHDLPEAQVGDITPHDGIPTEEKHEREAAAARHLLPPSLAAKWLAYEAQDDAESRFVRQLDRLDMALQAIVYAPHADIRPFLASARRGIHDAMLLAWLDAFEARIRPSPGEEARAGSRTEG